MNRKFIISIQFLVVCNGFASDHGHRRILPPVRPLYKQPSSNVQIFKRYKDSDLYKSGTQLSPILSIILWHQNHSEFIKIKRLYEVETNQIFEFFTRKNIEIEAQELYQWQIMLLECFKAGVMPVLDVEIVDKPLHHQSDEYRLHQELDHFSRRLCFQQLERNYRDELSYKQNEEVFNIVLPYFNELCELKRKRQGAISPAPEPKD